jgi:hypothetical protein
MIIIDVSIGIDGVPSEKSILLGNKYENNDTIIEFDLPADFENYNKYVVAVNGNTTRIIPVINNQMAVSSALTELSGNWAMYLMCRESAIDLSVYVPDISAKDNEHVFISDGFVGTVVNIQIDKRTVERIPLDTNLKIAYDDLMNLKAYLLEQVAGIDAYYEKTDTNTTDIAQIKEDLADVKPNVVTGGSDYGEVAVWDDGNPNSEDRLYRFVTVVGDSREVDIANSTSQIVGTSNIKANVGFLGNYTEGAENDTTKTIVSILGVSYVKTNDNTIMPNDRVMSDDNGYAVKSTNNLGYRVLKVVEPGLLEIIVSPNSDMIQRIKTDMESKVDKIEGKGLSSNDFTKAEKEKLSGLSNYDDSGVRQDITNLQNNKVNKVDGKGLSSNDFTTEEKQKLENLSSAINSKFIESGLGILKTGKLYGVKVWKSSANTSTILEKTRDNAGLVCEPSTDTVVGRDDYADIPLFQWVKCNYKRYDDGFAYPVAIEGDGNYKETDDVDCGAMQPTFWYGYVDADEYKELIISDSPNEALGLKPWEQAVRADGTVMPYFIQSRYPSVVGSDGLLHSQPGKKISRVHSHNSMITNYQKKGAGYWGAGSDRYTFGQIFMMIKHGVKSVQKKMNGVCNWNIQYKASVESDTANSYFPVTNAQAANLQVGLCVSVGYGSESSNGSVNLDRGIGTMHAYADDAKILKIETLDDGNKAVYLDCEPFTTTPITGTYATQYIYMSSMHTHAGDTDVVIGHHDGSPVSNTDGKHPFRIQGIEYLHGAWIVASDTVMFFKEDYSKDVYYAPRGLTHSSNDTTIKETYTLVGNILPNNGSDFWIGDVDHVNGVWFPTSVVSSDQQGMGDRCYAGGKATSGSREYLQGGYLRGGSNDGLAALHCRDRLGSAYWDCASAD